MSGMLWVWVSRYFKGVHREVALQRPLLTASQRYLRRQRARARLVGEDPYHPRPPPLDLLEETLEHVRRAYAGVVASRVAQVGECVLYPRLEDPDGLRVALVVERGELLG